MSNRRSFVPRAACWTAGFALSAIAGTTSPAWAQFGPSLVVVGPVVEQAEVEAAVTYVGTVQPKRRSLVGSAVDGRVLEFYVNAGDRVEEGQPLAQLRIQTITAQLEAARAEQTLREQELEELRNGTRPQELRQAEEHMLAMQALREYAEKKLLHTQALFEKRAASEDQLQNDLAARDQAVHAHLEAEALFELAQEGPRPERIAQAQARLETAQQMVVELEDRLEKHTVKAPFSGYVVAEHTEVGQWIKQGELVVEVVEVDQVDVQAMVPENYVPLLSLGDEVAVTLPALPGREFIGRVQAIVPQADLRSRSFPVQIRVDNELLSDGGVLLRPGMFAQIALPASNSEAVVLVSKDALVLGGPQPVVFVVDPSGDVAQATGEAPVAGVVRGVPVRLGVEQEELIVVMGLDPQTDAWVVVEGNERLRPGGEVSIVGAQQAPAADDVEPPQAAARSR